MRPSVHGFVKPCDFLPYVLALRCSGRVWSVKILEADKSGEWLFVSVVISLVLGCLAVVDHVVCKNRLAEEHRFHKRGVSPSGAVAVHVKTHVVAQRIEDVEIVDRLNEPDVGFVFVSRVQVAWIVAVMPVADDRYRFSRTVICLKCGVTVVFGFYAAYAQVIGSGFKTVEIKYCLLASVADVA